MSEQRSNWAFPKMSLLEWGIFAALAAALSAINVYTTLLTGWGEGGSILAVLAATIFLRAFSRPTPVRTLNLGQTMVSAGGYMGFSIASYAAVVLANPEFAPSMPAAIGLYLGAGLVGVFIGISVRPWFLQYHFPSGTACAVIQTTVTDESSGDGRRPLRILAIWGSLAGLVTIPVKLALKGSSSALLAPLSFGKGLALHLDPLLYGIGAVIGPRIAFGLVGGALVAQFGLGSVFQHFEVAPAFAGQWTVWIAISFMVLPTVASIAGTMFFKEAAPVPSTFTPGKTTYAKASGVPRWVVLAVGAAMAVLSTAGVAPVPLWTIVCVLVATVPLSLMNGRVAGDTDINPVLLAVAAVIFGFFAVFEGTNMAATALLCLAVLGGAVVTIAVDLLYDYRTGYLLDQDPGPQKWTQFSGVVIGALAGVPFIMLLHSQFGFGEGGLPAPGPRIYTQMALDMVSAGSAFSSDLTTVIIVVSASASVYAFIAASPKFGRFMPSVFGIGIGMLIGFAPCAGILVGALIRTAYLRVRAKSGAADDAERDVLLAGASTFAAGALVSVVLILLVQLLHSLGVDAVHMAH